MNDHRVPLKQSTAMPHMPPSATYSNFVQVTLNSDTVADREAIGNVPINGADTTSCPSEKTREDILFGGCERSELYNIAAATLSAAVLDPFSAFELATSARLVPRSNKYDIPNGMIRPVIAAALAFPDVAAVHTDLPPEAAEAERYYADLERRGGSYMVWQTWWKVIVSYGIRWKRQILPMSEGTAIGIVLHLARAGYAFGTIRNVRWTISKAHLFAALPSPTVGASFRMYFKLIRKDLGTDSPNRKARVEFDDLRRVGECARERGTMQALQQWTMIDVDYFSTLRRENLVDLNIEDLSRCRRGYEVHVRRGKNHQHSARDFFVGMIPDDPLLCPVANLDRWLHVLKCAGYTEGPLFRHFGLAGTLTEIRLSSRTVTRAIKRYMGELTGASHCYAAQSLRRGFITRALISGVSQADLRALTGHKLVASLDPYFDPAEQALNLSQAVTYGAARERALPAARTENLAAAVWAGSYGPA